LNLPMASKREEYEEVLALTKSLAQKLGLGQLDCPPLESASLQNETERLHALKHKWTAQLLSSYTDILHEVNGVGQIYTTDLLQNIHKTHPVYDERLVYLDKLVQEKLPEAFNTLWEDIKAKASQASLNCNAFRKEEAKRKDIVQRLKYLKKVVQSLDEQLAQNAKPTEPPKKIDDLQAKPDELALD
jgi:hypothetical protein